MRNIFSQRSAKFEAIDGSRSPAAITRRRRDGVVQARQLAGAVVLASTCVFPNEALAKRPYKSTDADVVRAREFELEVGLLTVERMSHESTYIAPSIVLNYGLSDRLELVGEFDLEKSADESWEIAEPGLFLKWLLAEGALQGRTGVSFALEAGALLPLSSADDRLGGEALFIASGNLEGIAIHANLGGGVDRAGDRFWTWGVIGELPMSSALTLATEIAGEHADGESPERSVLMGVIYQPEGSSILLDVAARHGLTSASADWEITLGLTANF